MKRKHGAMGGEVVALQSHWGKTSRFCAMLCNASQDYCCHHQHARIGIGIQLHNLPLSLSTLDHTHNSPLESRSRQS
jgi:hypothetical protein